MSAPIILTYPGLGLFTGMFAAHFDIRDLPSDAAAQAEMLAGPAREAQAIVAIGSIGVPPAIYDLPRLALIACFGVGYDRIDLERARARAIAVTNCPQINHEDVADLAIGLMLSATRSIAHGDRIVRAGVWRPPLAVPPPRRLKGRKLGIVGYGAIGQAIAARAEAFGLDIAWWGPRPKSEARHPRRDTLKALAAWADILALALRPDPGTEGMVGADVLDALGPDGVLINVARGSVVDEAALIAALRQGRIAAAGLDVFAEEPTPPDAWTGIDAVTLTPHLAGATRESIFESAALVLDNLRRHFAGQPLATPVP